jgi:hypothetical protein
MSDNDFEDEDMASSISSSPTIPDENIDFNFVYALHTFLATVEGQATCQKGDTLVLLDDTNSYWWLVRNIKDQSIGYLPAEHIETPPERLARYNKHRNVGEGASHLDDITQPPPKPSKFSLRRNRKASKGVVFAAPTVVVYDVYYDTDEERELEEAEAAQARDLHAQQVMQGTTIRKVTEGNVDEEENVLGRDLAFNNPTKKVSLTPDYARDRPNTGTTDTADTGRPSHNSNGSQGSISSVRSLLSDSSSKLESPKDKKKKNVFGGLFKKKAKKDTQTDTLERTASGGSIQSNTPKLTEPASKVTKVISEPRLLGSLEQTGAAQHVSTSVTKKDTQPQSQRAVEDTMAEHKLSNDFALPAGVQEMRSSKLMSVDPVTAEFIEEPRHRGAVDEMEMLTTQQGSSRRSSQVPIISDAALKSHVQDEKFYKTFMLIIQDDARKQLAKQSQRQLPPTINAHFEPVEAKLNTMLKVKRSTFFDLTNNRISTASSYDRPQLPKPRSSAL